MYGFRFSMYFYLSYNFMESKKGFKPSRQCSMCGYYLNGRAGVVCPKCFNACYVPVTCRFCNETTLVHETRKDRPDWHICPSCDQKKCMPMKCDQCEKISEIAIHTSYLKGSYTCHECRGKIQHKCKECNEDFWDYNRVKRKPICFNCRLKRYAPRSCIKCNEARYFHKLRKPGSCICHSCYKERKQSTE